MQSQYIQIVNKVRSTLKSCITSFLPLFTLLTLLLLGGFSTEVLAAWTGSGEAVKKVGSTYYVVYDETGGSLTKGNTRVYTLSGPGATLTFQAKREPVGTGNLLVTQNSGTAKLYEGNPGYTTSTFWGVETGVGYSDYNATVDNASNTIVFKNDASISTNTRKYYQNVKVTMAQYLENPSTTSLDCGTADINTDATSNTVTVAWCNVPAMTYKIENDANNLFSVSVSNNSEAGKYNTATYTVSYKHTKAGTHTATLKITDTFGSYSKTVYLTGTTNKLTPGITWSSNDDIFNVEDELSATNANGLGVTLSSTGNESYVACSGSSAVMLAATSGSITINAHVTGNDIYADKDFTKTISITSLEKQHITWTQDFSRLKTTDASKSITLNATSDSGLPVSYELNGDKTGLTLSKSGNVWTLTYSAVECKNTTIVAKQGGDGATYAPASSVSLPVKVIDPTKVCDVNNVLITSAAPLEMSNTSQTKNIDIPSTMQIIVKRSNTSWYATYLYGFDVEFYTGRNGTGDKIGNTYSYSSSDINTSKTINFTGLSREAKSVKLISNALYGYTVTSVTYTQQKYCEISRSSLPFETYPNTATTAQTFSVNYANYPISLECSNNKFTISPLSFGDCGEHDTQLVSVSYTAGADEGEDSGVIYIKDNTGVTLQTCSLSVEIRKLAQSITSTTIGTAYNTTDRIELSPEANSGLTYFEYSADPQGIASFDGNIMTFSQSGTIAITVTQPGTNVYAPTSTTVNNVVVSKVTPTIFTNPNVATIKYKDNLINGEGSQLSGGHAEVTLRGVEHTKVDGTFTWTTPAQITDAPGTHNYSVTFTPDNTGMYNSNTFDRSVTVARADGGIEMNNGNVKVKVAGINDNLDEYKIDLDDLIKSKIVDSGRAGAVSFEVISNENKAFSSIDANNVFSATKVGTYTIRATQAQSTYYEAASDEFTVTVEHLDPTIVFDNTDDPQILFSNDSVAQPAYRMYNGHLIDRNVQYVSNNYAIYADNTKVKLFARNVDVPEGSAVRVVVTASTTEDAIYSAASVTVAHNYDVYAKRSPVFIMDGHENENASKTMAIGETATITYNENTDETFSVGTETEKDFISYVHDKGNRTITVTAVKGSLIGDGVQTVTLTQPGNEALFQRQIVYTFTVKRNVSALSLDALTTSMSVEDTVATPYVGLANTSDAVEFTCSPAGSMKMEDGKLIALQAGTNIVTFSQPTTEYWTGVSQSKTITVSKHNATISTELANRYAWFSTIEHPFSSTNPDVDLVITSSDEQKAKYVAAEDKIYVYGTSGNVTFTVNQEGNYKYNPIVNYTRAFNVFKPNNHVPFTLTEGNFDDYRGGTRGNVSWNNGGVLCGGASGIGIGGAGWDWSAKYIILHFTGIPDTLTFDFVNANPTATQYGWHFYQKSETGDWTVLSEYADLLMNATGGTSEGSEALKLNPDTRYVKLEYHGNFGGRFRNVSVTERKEIAPSKDTLDFGLSFNGNDPTTRKLALDWYNVNTCRVYVDGADADRFILSDESDTIYSQLDDFGDAELTLTYKHDENSVTEHKAILHIVEVNPNGTDGISKEVVLLGQTTRAPQTIVWREDLTPMPSEGEFENAAYATSGGEVVLTSLNPEYVAVSGLTLSPVAPGIARVRAYQAGNEKWAEVADTLTIEVTTKKVQYIIWTDNLSNRKREDGETVNITLTATSTAGLPITYDLDNAAKDFASISGNVLTLTGWGRGTVIARQAGTDEYVGVQKSKLLVSRNPDEGCKPLVGEQTEEYTIWTLGVKEISLSGEPGTIEFDASCNATALHGLWVAEYYDGYYHDVIKLNRLGENNITSSEKHFGPFDLNRATTKVKFYTHTGATMNRSFKNVEVVLAKYLEVAENNMDFSTMDYGASKDQTFYVNYSNITGQLDVELESPSSQFTILTPTLGEDCGDAAKDVPVRIRYVGSVIGTENNAIIISNKNQSLRVPISATVTPVSQAITWNPTLNIHTTDNVQLSATATSTLEVTFTSNNAEIAEPYRKDNGTWWLNIHKQGNVEIVAHQAGNEYWRAAEDQTREFHISRVTPNILVYPTATGVTLPNTLSASTLVGGSVENDIEGSFQWQNSSQAVTRGTESYGAMFAPENGNYYDTVRFNVSVEIIKTPQIITWDRADVTEQWCNDTIVCDASSSSNQPITYHSSDSSVAYVIADTLRIFKYGTITITAEQAGDEDFDAASVSKQITLKRAIVTLTLPEPSDMFVHHYLTNSVLNNGSATSKGKSVGGVFTWQKDSLMDVPGANDNCVALFTPFNTDIYAPQTCSLTVNVLRYAPGVSTNDLTTDPAPRGTKLSELVLRGSATLIDDKDPERPEISGTYSWKYPDYEPTENETSAIYVFHPDNSTWYNDLEISVPIFISKYTPRITQTLVASDITYGQALSKSNLSGSFIAWDSIRDVKVNGSYAWVDGSQVLDAGDYNELVRFTPTNTAWYESVEFEVAVHVNKATPSVSVTASEITIGQKLKDSYLESTGTPGTPVWASCLNLDTIFGREGNYNLPYEFTPDDASNYTTKTGTVTLRVGTGDLYVFSAKGGNHKWDNEDNWENYMGVPGKDANVLINSSVEIESIVDIDKLTIKAGVEVVVKDGGSLTIKSGSVPGRNYGNLRVANGGKASLPVNVGINDLTIEAALGNYVKHIPASSAQVDGASLSNVNGNVYFQLSFDPSGKISAGWYDFVVPFEVEVVGGIYSVSNSSSPLINRVDFGIMEFREDKRALNEKAWYWCYGTLEPGRLYSITLDDCHPERNTYLFKKKAGSSIGASSSYNAVCSGAATKSIASSDKGWNGLGNGTLRYCQVSLGKDTKIQVYDHDNACYVPLDAADYSYAIGTAFFVQVSSNQSIDLRAVNDNANKRFLAPAREDETIEEFRLALTMEGEDAASDHLWVSASEEATGEYVIGKDLGKMGELTNSKVARMWAKNNGMSLCDIEMPMVYGEANCELNMYAPKQATYTLAVEEAPEDADLFLTYNGKVIWNLTSSPAQIVLNQGMKTDFGLILKSHNAPEIAEGVDNTDEENHSVRKVLIDNIIYVITPDGAMYDMNGKLIR